MDFSKILSALTTAKFQGGVVGRNLYSGVAFCVALVPIAIAVRGNQWLVGLIVVAILIIHFNSSRKANKFAEDNPELATMEGMEVSKFQKAVQTYASKNMPIISAPEDTKKIEADSPKNLLTDSLELEKVKNDAEET